MFKNTFDLFTKGQKQWLVLTFLITLTIAVFSPVIYGNPIWDDWIFIFRNDYFFQQSFLSYFPGGSFSRSWPLFYTSMWFLLRLFGDHYFMYHICSLSLHGLNGYLIWRLASGLKLRSPMLLAILYLVHPLQLLTVGWTMQFKTILSIFFLMTALLALLKFYQTEKTKFFVVALVLFGCSLLSKSTTICFMFVLPVLWSQSKHKFEAKKLLLISSPFIFLGVLAFSRTISSYTSVLFDSDYMKVSFIDRLHVTLKVFARYIEFLIWPKTNMLFQKRVLLNYSALEFSEVFVVLTLVANMGKTFFLKKSPLLKGGYIFFLSSLLPFCGLVFIPIYTYSNFVPYWLSTPVLGLIPVLSYYMKDKRVLVALICVFALTSHIQAYAFKSHDKLILDSIEHSPEEKLFYVALIEQYVYSGDCKKAQKAYEQLTKLSGTMEVPLLTKVHRCIENH